MVKAIPMEDWLRGCVYSAGERGEVTLPVDKVLKIADYIQLARTSPAEGMIELDDGDSARNIDAVQVVRCKDCKHNPKTDVGWISCPMTGRDTRKANDYCSYGERSEE